MKFFHMKMLTPFTTQQLPGNISHFSWSLPAKTIQSHFTLVLADQSWNCNKKRKRKKKGKESPPTPCIIRLNKRDLKSYYLISTFSVDTFAGQYFLSFMLLTSILTFTSQWFFIHLLMTLHLFCFGFFFLVSEVSKLTNICGRSSEHIFRP